MSLRNANRIFCGLLAAYPLFAGMKGLSVPTKNVPLRGEIREKLRGAFRLPEADARCSSMSESACHSSQI